MDFSLSQGVQDDCQYFYPSRSRIKNKKCQRSRPFGMQSGILSGRRKLESRPDWSSLKKSGTFHVGFPPPSPLEFMPTPLTLCFNFFYVFCFCFYILARFDDPIAAKKPSGLQISPTFVFHRFRISTLKLPQAHGFQFAV